MTVEALNNRIQQLERLLEVGRNLSSLLDLEPLLHTIIDVATDLTHSQESSILIHDPEKNNLEFLAAPWFKHDKLRLLRVPLKGSIAGQAFTFGEPIMVQDAPNDMRHYKEVDEASDFETKSMLAVPMIFKGKTQGVLTALNKLGDVPYTQEDVHILETLASQAVIAIQNADFLQQSQAAYKEVSELDRMKTDFIAITSHELRTPLGLILGHATFLEESVPEEFKSQLEVIVRNSNRLKDIVDDLAKVNYFQTGKSQIHKREVDLNIILWEVVNSLSFRAEEKKIDLRLDVPPTHLVINGDGDKLAVGINHLVRNAIAFSDAGGIVNVVAHQLPDKIKIDVIDTGIGIPDADIGRIFERFYQIEDHMTRRHGGMGLGLAVAKMMIEMHDGRLGVISKVGKGSTFTVILPTEPPQTKRRATPLLQT